MSKRQPKKHSVFLSFSLPKSAFGCIISSTFQAEGETKSLAIYKKFPKRTLFLFFVLLSFEWTKMVVEASFCDGTLCGRKSGQVRSRLTVFSPTSKRLNA